MAGFRVAVHVHSEWSYDGSWSLQSIARAFRRRRYDAVLLCEHDRGLSSERLAAYRDACRRESRGIRLVAGVEYSDPANIVHVPTWGPATFLGEGMRTTDVLRTVQEQGGVALLAHPSRHNAWDHLDASWPELLTGVEVWSRKYDGWAPNRRALRFAASTGLIPFASLDFHRRRQFAPLAMMVDVPDMGGRAEPVGESALLESIRARRCQATAARLPAHVFNDGAAGAASVAANAVRRIVAGGAKRLLP